MQEMIGRGKEMSVLESLYGKPSSVLMYGRRRVGKTFLLAHFCEGKRSLFLTCVKGSVKDNLAYFEEEVAEFLGVEEKRYEDERAFVRDLAIVMKREAVVVVIDEYQYLTDACPSVSSHIQYLLDHELEKTSSMIVLCGSSEHKMRRQGEDGNSPLYGRFSRIIRLAPLPFEDCRGFHPGMSDFDCMKLYLTVGGIPRYHREMCGSTFEECIRDNYLANEWMMEEAVHLIEAEFRQSSKCLSIISAISGGRYRLNDIAEYADMHPSDCKGLIDLLIEAGIISKRASMFGSKKPRYFVEDNMFAFHFEVLARRRHLFDCNDPFASYLELEHHIGTFLGARFEHYCSDYIVRHYPVQEIGKWWLDDPKKGLHIDIDIVAKASVRGNRVDLFGECKFSLGKMGFHEYNNLEERVDGYMKDANSRLMFFSVSGFDRKFEEFARGIHVMLFGPEVLFGYREPDAIWLGADEHGVSDPRDSEDPTSNRRHGCVKKV